MTSLPQIFRHILDERGVHYKLFAHEHGDSLSAAASAMGIDPARIACASILRDSQGIVMVIYPPTRKLDLGALNAKMQRSFSVLKSAGHHAPLASAYRMQAIIDESLASADEVYLALDPGTLCRVSPHDFMLFQGTRAWFESTFTTRIAAAGVARNRAMVHDDVRRRLRDPRALPAMPAIAQDLLVLSANPYVHPSELAKVIERDAGLATQVIRFSQSPLYGYHGPIQSVQEAISRSLGFDMVLDIALGLSLGRALRGLDQGPLGLNAFWRHAAYSAVLTQRLGQQVRGVLRPRPGMAYLAGMLHNIGVLLLGHLFPAEYGRVNEQLNSQTERPLAELERELLGVDHAEAGACLMESWELPEEIITAVCRHHDPQYHGGHAIYPHLVSIANHLLSAIELGDEHTTALPDTALQALGISTEQALDVMFQMLKLRDGLEDMALAMAA